MRAYDKNHKNLDVWLNENDVSIQFNNKVQKLNLRDAKILKFHLDLALHVSGDICYDRCCDEYGY